MSSRNRVARLNASGTLDTSFNPNANNEVLAVVRQPDAGLENLPLGLTMGMFLSIPMMLIGAWLIWRAWNRPPTAAA